MAYVTYDKAKWHWGAKNAPTDIPQENGATKITFKLYHISSAGAWSASSTPRTSRRISRTI